MCLSNGFFAAVTAQIGCRRIHHGWRRGRRRRRRGRRRPCLQAICKQHERILSLVVGEFATGLFYLRDNPGPSPDLYGRCSSTPQGNSSQGTLPGLVSKPLCSPEPPPRPDSARSTARPSRVGSPRVLGRRGNPRNNRFAPISTLSPRWRRGV